MAHLTDYYKTGPKQKQETTATRQETETTKEKYLKQK